MRTNVKWNNYMLFFFILLTLASCNNKSGNNKAALIGDPLYVLFTDKASFLNFQNGPIVFSFVANSSGKITLHGWHFRGPAQDYLPPALKLEPGLASTITLPAGVYLGDIVISANDKAAINQALQQVGANFVALVPDPLAAGVGITYSIYVVKDNPSQVYPPKKIDALGDTNLDANPSPPKGIN